MPTPCDTPSAAGRPAPAARGPVGRRWAAVRRSLGWRLIFFLGGSLLLLLGGTGWLALRLHRQHLVRSLEQVAVGIGETILASTHTSMLENDREHLREIIAIVGRNERILAVRVVNAQGTVSFSSSAGEVGTVADVSAPACAGCHAQGTPRAPATLRDGLQLYPLPGGRKALGLAVPVLNASECWSAGCHVHSPQQRVLGLLDVELSMRELEAAMASGQRQLVLLFGGTILVVCTLTGLLAMRVVHRPIQALLRGTRELAGGDLSHRIQVDDAVDLGELGELAQSFDHMAASLEQAHTELDRWGRTLEQRVAEKTRELERARDQMVFAEKMASLGKMAAIVAHEINNPLAGILVSAKLVRRRLPAVCAATATPATAMPATPAPAARTPGSVGPVPAASGAGAAVPAPARELDETLAMIEREAARCGDIARNLLLFSRRRDLSAAPEDVNEIVRRSLRLLRHQIELQQVAVTEQLDPQLPQIVCDAGQIEQAVVALVMNAVEAMPDGGELRVATLPLQERAGVRVVVADTGPGIPPEIQGRIFEPFFSTKKQGQGTGLGLAVLYGIVQRHHGRVDFTSKPDGGTTFVIELPATPPSSADDPRAAAPADRGGRD